MSVTVEAPPPHVQAIQMATAFWVSKVVYAAVKLDLADRMADGPRTAEEMARETGTQPRALYRLLRTLASLGYFSEDGDHRFSLTPLGAALQTGAPGAAKATILTLGNHWCIGCFEEIFYSLETGKPAFEKVVGMPIFEYFAQHPDEAALFSETMVGFHGEEPAAVAAAYDFSGFDTVIDVGGATGNLISTILAKYPQPKGVLFDLPHVVADAGPLLRQRGVAERIEIKSGSFFESVPEGGDAYLMSHIIHDWTEEQCLTILGNCRRSMRTDGRLLIIEMVLPPGNTPHPGKILDMMMLVGPGGQERTEEEYAELLAKAGFRLTRVIPTQSAVSIVEAMQA